MFNLAVAVFSHTGASLPRLLLRILVASSLAALVRFCYLRPFILSLLVRQYLGCMTTGSWQLQSVTAVCETLHRGKLSPAPQRKGHTFTSLLAVSLHDTLMSPRSTYVLYNTGRRCAGAIPLNLQARGVACSRISR